MAVGTTQHSIPIEDNMAVFVVPEQFPSPEISVINAIRFIYLFSIVILYFLIYLYFFEQYIVKGFALNNPPTLLKKVGQKTLILFDLA